MHSSEVQPLQYSAASWIPFPHEYHVSWLQSLGSRTPPCGSLYLENVGIQGCFLKKKKGAAHSRQHKWTEVAYSLPSKELPLTGLRTPLQEGGAWHHIRVLSICLTRPLEYFGFVARRHANTLERTVGWMLGALTSLRPCRTILGLQCKSLAHLATCPTTCSWPSQWFRLRGSTSSCSRCRLSGGIALA